MGIGSAGSDAAHASQPQRIPLCPRLDLRWDDERSPCESELGVGAAEVANGTDDVLSHLPNDLEHRGEPCRSTRMADDRFERPQVPPLRNSLCFERELQGL